MIKTTWLCASLLILTLGGCTVEKTQDGEMPKVDVDAKAGNLPDYDVVKKEDGKMPDVDVTTTGGQLPKYDVNMASVEINPTTATVTVPDVDISTKEKQITVPDVDVKMPEKKNP